MMRMRDRGKGGNGRARRAQVLRREVFPSTLDPRPSTLPPRGFTLVELLVVIAVITILASLVLTAAFRAMDLGKQTQCRSNLSQIGKGFWLYVQRNAQWMPAIGYPPEYSSSGHYTWWYDAMIDQIGHPKIIMCPSKPQTKLGYGYNVRFADPTGNKHCWNQTLPLNTIRKPSVTIGFSDCGNVVNWDTHPPPLWDENDDMPASAKLRFPYTNSDGLWASLSGKPMPRHRANANFLMFDGSVPSHRVEDILRYKYGEPGCLFDND